MGTGVGDMIERCRNVGLLEPEFYLTDGFVTIIRRKPEQAFKAVTPQVTPQVGTKSSLSRHQVAILEKCVADATLLELMAISRRSDRTKFRQQVINPLRADGLIEMTIPDKLRSSLQKYRLTENGHYPAC